MRITAIVAAVLAAASTLAAERAAEAQTPNGPLTGSFELGARSFLRDLSSQQLGKLTEYKDVPSGGVLQQASLQFIPGDSLRQFQFVGRRIGALDQSLWFRANQPGLFDVQARFDRIPHTFSTTARALGNEASPGVYVLPTPRPDTATLNGSGYLSPIRTLWDPFKLSATLTPTSSWDSKVEYTHIAKSGGRPMGLAFGGPSNNAREIVEPIDQTMQGFRVTQSYSRTDVQFVGSYDLSTFSNALSSVTSDNPLVAVDATNVSSRGRSALPPSNMAQTIAGTGAVSLPFSTRVTSTATYGWWRQNENFVPATINSALTDPRIATIPSALGGLVQTSLFSASLSSRPVTPLSLTARFRSYVYRDHAMTTTMPVMVINDRSISPADSGERDPFRKDNADVGATWRLPVPVSVSAGYAWEQMDLDPEVRNVGRYTETTPRASIDFTGIEWATLHATYSKGWRRSSSYQPLDASVNPAFRRFDVADRDRERLNLMADVTPIDMITVSGMWQTGHDGYPSSSFGVQSDKNSAVGADVSFAWSQRFSAGAGYSRETYQDMQRSRYRSGTQTANTTYDWVARNTDNVNTTSANATAVIVPERLEVGGTFELSHARFRMAAFNPQTPTGGTTAQNTAATAHDLPEVTQTLQPLSAYVRYHVTPEWAMTLRYQGELYGQNDFRTLGLQPATGNFVFLGNNFMNYNARFLTVSVSYRPMPIRFGRSTL